MSAAARTGQRPSGLVLATSQAVIRALDWSGRVIAVACLGFMFALLLVNVVLRYTLGEGIAWAYEIHALLLPWLVAAGVVIAAARGANIAITLLPDMLSLGARRVLILAVQAAVLVICLSVLASSPPILKASTFQTLATLGIKQVWGYSSLIYAFSGMAVIAALELLSVLAGKSVDPADISSFS